MQRGNIPAYHVKEVAPLHALRCKVAVVRKLHHAISVLVVAVGYQQQQLALDSSATHFRECHVARRLRQSSALVRLSLCKQLEYRLLLCCSLMTGEGCSAHRTLQVQKGVGHLRIQLHKSSGVLDDLRLRKHTLLCQPALPQLLLLGPAWCDLGAKQTQLIQSACPDQEASPEQHTGDR